MVSMHTSPAQAPGTGDSGGMNVALLATAHELALRGVAVDLVTRAAGPASVTEIEPDVTVHELPAGPPGSVPKAELPGLTREFGEQLARLASRPGRGFDIIHAHYWLSGMAAQAVASDLGVPFVQSFHTLGAMKNQRLAPGQRAEPARRLSGEQFLALRARAVVTGSSVEATTLIDEMGADAERIWVVPPGVDVAMFRPERADEAEERVRGEWGIGPGRPILVVVGRVQPLKGQLLAVRALAELHRLRGWAPVLLIAGSATPGDDGYLSALRRLASELGVSDSVRFVGALSREQLAEVLAVATITLIPSFSETFGLVALESAASGTPVIGYRDTGLVESIADGRSGKLLDSREPSVWAESIQALLDDRPSLTALSASARLHALGFSWGASVTTLLGVYGGLLT